jgi:outer membrane protein assembly factor BamB
MIKITLLKEKLFLLTLGCFLVLLAEAQKLEMIAETGLDVDFREYFLSDGQRQFYLTEKGDRLLVNTDLRYVIIDAQSGKEIASGEHLGKINTAAQTVGLNTAAPVLSFDEGSAFYVLEEAKKVLFLDWNPSKNVVKMVSLVDGTELWNKSEFRITASLSEQFFRNYIGGGSSLEDEAAFTRPRLAADGVAFFGDNLALTRNSSAVAQNLLLHLPDANQMVLKTTSGLVGISVDTGDKIWEYADKQISMAAIFSVPDSKDVIFINNYESALSPMQRSSVDNFWMARISGDDGSAIWRTNYTPPFNNDRIYFYEDKFCTDFDNIVCRNLSDGKITFSSSDDFKNGPLMQKAKNDMRAAAKFEYPSLFDGPLLYETDYLIKGISVGGFQSKALKYDMNSGDLLWDSEWLPKRTELYYLTDTKLIMEQSTGIAKTNLIGLDAKTGEQLFATDEIKHYWFRNGAGAIFTDEAVYISGKTETVVYEPENFDVLKTFDTKAADIGKLQAMYGIHDQIAYVGDKGFAVFNGRGEVTLKQEARRIGGAFWNEKTTMLLDRDDIKVINNDAQEVSETLEIPFDDRFLYFFNQSGDLFTIINTELESIRIYSLSF